MDLRHIVAQLTAPLRRRVMLMIGRAILLLVDDDKLLQTVQVQGLADETLDRVERFQTYGLTSRPHPGAECIVVAMGGIRQHPVVIAVDDRRYRVRELETGDVCLYTDQDEAGSPHRIVLGRAGSIKLATGTSSVELLPSEIVLTAEAFRQVRA